MTNSNPRKFEEKHINFVLRYWQKIIVGSQFLDWAQFNEFVESGSGSWALIRRRLVLRGEKRTGSNGPRSQGEGTPRPRTKIPNSSRIPRASLFFLGLLLPPPPHFVRSLLLYILLLHPSFSYTCQSSMSILECTSHRSLFLTLCELLWLPSHCPGVTSTSIGLGC